MLNNAIKNVRTSIIIYSYAQEQAAKEREKTRDALKKLAVPIKSIYEDVYKKK